MSKIAASMIIFNGDYVLKECLTSIYPHVDQILISEGPVQYWQDQGFTTSSDGTNQVLEEFDDPDNKIVVVHGQFKEKNEQCSAHMEHLRSDMDFLWLIDCDEMYKEEDIKKLKIMMDEGITSAGFKSMCFYGGFDDYLTGFEQSIEIQRLFRIYPGSSWKSHRPPIIQHTPHNTILNPRKHADGHLMADVLGIYMYHYSYVFADQVAQKVGYYSDSLNVGGCIPNYFDNVYLPWVCGDRETKRVVEQTYQGTHEWRPERRSPCYTAPFTGEHPAAIKENLEGLKKKFNEQLARF